LTATRRALHASRTRWVRVLMRLSALVLIVAAGPALAQQCADGIDNDVDGQIDLDDVHCRAPYDNDEFSFGSDTLDDDTHSVSSLDCWFDGNGGSGDDGCSVHACCLLDVPCPAHLSPQTFNPANCSVSEQCIEACLPLVKPKCDCFGCCTICPPGQSCVRALVNPAVSPNCTLATLGDPSACQPCEGDLICKLETIEVFRNGFEDGKKMVEA
jgi:hypothetical protein